MCPISDPCTEGLTDLPAERQEVDTFHSFMGTVKCHEHFLLFPRDSAHATFPAPAS